MVRDVLAEPIQIGCLQAKNRILMPPMYRPWSKPSGKVSDRHIAYYRDRAQGGVGTIVVETTAVRREYRLSESNIGIWTDGHIKGLSKIAKVIRSNKVLAFIQINDTAVNRALSFQEITTIRSAFVDAAMRAQKADFQGVEIHAAHGFLLSQLLCPKLNQQKNEYGGTTIGRMRLLLEIITLIREKTNLNFTVGVRLGIDSLEEGIKIAQKLSPLVNYLSISYGALLSNAPVLVPPDYPFSPTVYRAEQIKPYVRVPVVAVGEIKTGDVARRILNKDMADLIAVGTAILMDPHWAKKALQMSTT